MTGELYDATTLERWNVVNRVLPDDGFDQAARLFARKLAARAPIPIEILPERAEENSLPDASVDTVLVTDCDPDQIRTLADAGVRYEEIA